jgi:hypothetical protein
MEECLKEKGRIKADVFVKKPVMFEEMRKVVVEER